MAKRVLKERWEVEWVVLTEAAEKREAADPNYERDHDRDEETLHAVFTTEAKALACAKMIVEHHGPLYGHATVTHQRLEKIEGTRLWDWENVGEPVVVEPACT